MTRHPAAVPAVVFALLLTALGPPATPALAARPLGQTEGASAARLALAAIPPWIEVASTVNLDFRVEPVTDDLEIDVTVHEPTTNRTEFERTVAGDDLGGAVGSIAVPLDSLSPGPTGTHRLSIDLGEAAEGLPSIPLTRPGVYPMSVRLRVAGAESPADTLVTHLVVLDEDNPPTRLAVAWIWPISVEMPLTRDYTPAETLTSAIAPTGHLAQFTDALGTAPDVPVTLAPSPATLDAWALLAAGRTEGTPTTGPEGAPPEELAAERLETLRNVIGPPGRQILAGPYAPTDLTDLVAAGQEPAVRRQLAGGVDVLRGVLGIRPDPRTLLASNLDGDTLSTLRDAGVDRLVVEPDVLEPVFSNLTLARPFELRAGGRTFDTALVDRALSQLVIPNDPDDSAEQVSEAALAQRLLAGLVTVALEAPGEERGVVLAPPATWTPSANLLVTVLRGLVGHPALRGVTVDAFFGRITPADDADVGARTLSPSEPDALGVDPGALARSRRRIEALSTMLGEAAPEVAAADRLALLATAAATRSGSEAREFLAGLDTIVATVTGSVELPTEPAVTLTAQRGRIPLSFVNRSSSPLRVQVRLASDKLLFPDGETHDLVLPPRTTTAQFTVEARTSGTFPLSIEVTSPDGSLLVGTVTMQIRSTAVSGVALAITVGAGLFLVGWWGNHIRRARQRRRAEAADGSPDDSDDAPDPGADLR